MQRIFTRSVALLVLLLVTGTARADLGDYSVIPVAKDDALVFAPGEEAVLTVKALNDWEADVRLVAAVRDFQGVAVNAKEKIAAEEKGETLFAYGVRKYYRIDTLPDKTVGKGETVIKVGTDGEVKINLGKLPEGFYMLDLTSLHDKKVLSNRKYPLGVFEMPEC